MVQQIRSPENPGTTVVSIGHLTPWPENPGYRTQVWGNVSTWTILLFFHDPINLGIIIYIIKYINVYISQVVFIRIVLKGVSLKKLKSVEFSYSVVK